MAGMKGVVELLLQYTQHDVVWTKWQQSFGKYVGIYNTVRRVAFETNTKTLDQFLMRSTAYPRVTEVEEETMYYLLSYIKVVMTFNWQFDQNFWTQLLERIIDIYKEKPFRYELTQEVFRMGGMFLGKNRFAWKEIQTLNYSNLACEGIEITSIDTNFKGCNAILTTSRKEWVNIYVQVSNEYPFRSPSVTFKGSVRPKRFRKYEHIRIDEHFDYAFCAVDDSLRALLLETELGGVCYLDNKDITMLFI
jgi:hypothetical protein